MPPIFDEGADGEPRHPLTPTLLGRLEELLTRVDASPLLERRPMVALSPGHPPQIVLNDLRVTPEIVRKRLIPDVDLTTDPWLLRRLLATLEAQVLTLLSSGQVDVGALPFGVDLPVAMVATSAFKAFDRWMRDSDRPNALIDLHLMDVFADFPGYLRARDELHAMGYRLCLDGVTADALPFVDRAALGFDIVKVVWSPALASELTAAGNSRLKELADHNGRGRIVITDIDSDLGVRHAHAVGVTLFQGPWVEAALTAAPSAA